MADKEGALSFKPSPSVPLYTDLGAVYKGVPGVEDRYKQITESFEKAYGAAPEFYARAPGRVNLIGEHIDYEGYGVLPMAIRQDTVVAVRRVPGSSELVIGNVEGDKYPTQRFPADPDQAVDVANHSWANYFVSAYKGAFELLRATRPEDVPQQAAGLEVIVHGQVPTGSGLSSSSAFVCAAMLAVLAAESLPPPTALHAAAARAAEAAEKGSGLSSSAAIVCASMLAVLSAEGVKHEHLDKAAVAEAACKAERYVGVTSGGMDQAISMMGQQGVAMHVEFNPVRGVCVVLPPGATFVIANSLAVSNKAETAPKRYNLRVVECRLAAVLLAMALGMSREDALAKVRTLRDVEPLIAAAHSGQHDGATCAAAVAEHLKESYTLSELEDALGGKLADLLFTGEPGSVRALQVAEKDKYAFPLRKRAVHVYTEAQRVLDFRHVCEDASLPAAERLAKLGRLMSDSHASCADLYGCSCAELDTLVGIAKEAGALGARLTGAGWGGCMVSLVKDEQVEAFVAAMREQYYKPRVDSGSLAASELPEVLFATQAANGAALLVLQKEMVPA